jgi:hypothetical protein
MRDTGCRIKEKNGTGNLSVLCYCINLFYGNRDKDIHAGTGMGEEKELLFGEFIILRLLFWPLDSVCAGCNLPT